MRKVIGILIYTAIILIIGRNLSFLPRFAIQQSVRSETTRLEKETEATIAEISKKIFDRVTRQEQ